MDMKIAKITTYQPIQKISCAQKIKDFLMLKQGGLKLKTLARDVFDKILLLNYILLFHNQENNPYLLF